jgi:hypothetical protein
MITKVPIVLGPSILVGLFDYDLIHLPTYVSIYMPTNLDLFR